MDLQLSDKVALVTGGSKGIGRGIVELLLKEGASVANVNRSVESPDNFDAVITGDGQRYEFIQGDISDTSVCQRAVEQTLSRFGRLDIVINNAGVNDGVGLDAGPEAFVESLRRNLVHYYAVVHYALDALKASPAGSIVNITSKVADTGQGGTSGYAASKGGINALTREWAVDLAPHNIRANTVVPAEVWTPMYDQWLSTQADPEGERRKIEQMIPLGRRFTSVEEMAAMTVLLASPASSHTTGQIIYVDGGYTHLDRRTTWDG